MPGGVVLESDAATPAENLVSKHVWVESDFPDMGAPGVADARKDCGAKGDDVTDDTAALQACLSSHGSVFLPPGLCEATPPFVNCDVDVNIVMPTLTLENHVISTIVL